MTNLVKSLTLTELIARGAPKVFTTTSKAWKDKLVTWFETSPDGPKRKLYPAQVEMVFIDMISYALALLGAEAQIAVEQRWLAFATGKHLDVMAANNSTFRLKASPAVVTLRFTLTLVALTDTVIDAGTQVEASGDVVFVTDDKLIIEAGAVSGDVSATALVAGISGNGLVPGQITTLLDDISVDLTVVNIDDSTGGTDEETDDSLRFRAANAHDRISKAGPRESYRQQTRAYSPAIIAVAVTRPEPGAINVYPLLDAGAPDQAFLDGVAGWLDFETKRPQGDDLFVLAPEAVTFSISATVRGQGNLAELETLVATALSDAAAIWSKQLGSFLAFSVFTCAAHQIANVVDITDIVVTGVGDRQLAEHQFAVLTGITLTMEQA
jgi:phage-related baseplate assembly protein